MSGPPLIRLAAPADLARIAGLDRHIRERDLADAIGLERVLVAEAAGEFAGWLRHGLFWDNTPFMNLLFLLEPYRGRGLGRLLVETWERRMAAAGFRRLMTSTLACEDAQHFYRRLGYRDAGFLLLPEEASGEIILLKELGRGPAE